ncbi:MAG: DegT/DnrJ/EryC1/StrS family aminotransferase [candidate division WOR-3 bacterium]
MDNKESIPQIVRQEIRPCREGNEQTIEENRRRQILKRIHPKFVFPGEPPLGGWYTEEEVEAAIKTIRDSLHWNVGFLGDKEIKKFEDAFAEYIGTKYAIAINGAGTGLDMSMLCLNLKLGDEVISCAINFPGTHLAIIGKGANLVLCEPDPHTLNISPIDVIRRITPRTRAILATHMNGLSADMDALLEIAHRHPHPKYGPLKVIGDAARACGAVYKNTKVGKKGWMNVFSFQSKKLLCTLGEGGMITTDDPLVNDKIRKFRAFGLGIGWGTNYLMTKVQAAVGLVQLRRLDEMNKRRRKLAYQRTALLRRYIPELTLPYEPPGYKHVYYLYSILLPPGCSSKIRNHFIKILERRYKIGCVIANPPTYKSNKFIKKHTHGQRLPLSEDIGNRLLCPSLHPLMTEEENKYICAAICETYRQLELQWRCF